MECLRIGIFVLMNSQSPPSIAAVNRPCQSPLRFGRAERRARPFDAPVATS
jgi:hypothetical protein